MASRIFNLVIGIKSKPAEDGGKRAKGALRGVGDEAKRTETKLKATQSATAALGKAFVAIGGTFAAIQLFKSSIQASIEQDQALAQVEAGLRSTGNAAGLTAKQIAGVAREQQILNNVGDETILGMQSVLLTFTQISGETFPRTSQAVIDVAQKMGTDLKSAALQVGKALNDPIRGLDGLNRSGIQFTDQQKEVIKALAEGGRMAEAQGLILDELENQFGGAGAAAAAAAGGGMKSLALVLGDIQETILPLTEQLDSVSRALARISGSKEAASVFEIIAEASTKFTTLGVLSKVLDEIERQGAEVNPVLIKLADTLNEDLPTGLEATIEAAEKLHWEEQEKQAEAYRKELEEVARAAEEATRRFLAFVDELNRLREVHAEVALADIADGLDSIATGQTGGIVPLDQEATAAAYQQALEDGQSYYVNSTEAMGGWDELWAQVGEGFGASLMNAGMRAGDFIADAIIDNDFSRLEDQFADMGREMGGQMGAAIGGAFAGPVGAILGNILGQIIGDKVGAAVGRAVLKVLDVLGLTSDPARVLGSLNFASNFAGQGGTADAQSQASLLLDQLRQTFDEIVDIIGGTVTTTQNMVVELRRNGGAILQILDTATGNLLSSQEFASAQEAIEAGLAMLLETAMVNVQGPAAAAFEEILSTAVDRGLDQAMDDLRAVAEVAAGIEALAPALEPALEGIAELEAQLHSLGLSSQALAALEAELAEARSRAAQESILDIMGQVAAMLGRIPEQTERAANLQARVDQARFTLEAHMLMSRLQILREEGLIKTGLFNELSKAIGIAIKWSADLNNFIQSIPDAVNFGDFIGDVSAPDSKVQDVNVINEDEIAQAINSGAETRFQFLRNLEVMRTEDDGARAALAALFEAQEAIAAASRGGYNVPVDLQQEFINRSLAEFLSTLSDEELANALALLESQGIDTAAVLLLMGDTVDQVNDALQRTIDSLVDYRRSLEPGGGSPFSGGTPLEQAEEAFANVSALVDAILDGDTSALDELQDLMQTAFGFGQDAFGGVGDLWDNFSGGLIDMLDQVLASLGVTALPSVASPNVAAIESLEDTAFDGFRDMVRETKEGNLSVVSELARIRTAISTTGGSLV